MLDTAGGRRMSDSSSGAHFRVYSRVSVEVTFSQQPLRMESEASVPVYTKCNPDGKLVMPWKLGEELNDTRSMPTKVCEGRSTNKMVEAELEVEDAMRGSVRGVNAVHFYAYMWDHNYEHKVKHEAQNLEISHRRNLAYAKCILKTRQTMPFFAYFEHHEPTMTIDTPPVPSSHRRRPRRPPLRRVESDGVGVTSSIRPILIPERAKARSAD